MIVSLNFWVKETEDIETTLLCPMLYFNLNLDKLFYLSYFKPYTKLLRLFTLT